MNIDILTPFLGKPEDDNKFTLSKPFIDNGFTYATNGRICARMPSSEANTEDKFPNAKAVPQWSSFPLVDAKPFPNKLSIAVKECGNCEGKGFFWLCPECDGEGEVETESDFGNRYVNQCYTCKGFGRQKDECCECNGEGNVPEKGETVIDGVRFDWRLLLKVFALANVTYLVSPIGEDKTKDGISIGGGFLLFQSGELQGIVYGMRVSQY